MHKKDKWLEYLLYYIQNEELKPCPECGHGKVEVILMAEGRGSTTFHCKNCNVFRHYDGKKK